MGIKVYVSGISGNKEVKKHQQRVMMILDSKCIAYDVVDIAEPGKESEKNFMQQNSNAKNSKYPLPPQIFNEETYCGDYEEFDLANENDELETFLKVERVSRAQVSLERREGSLGAGENGEMVANHNGVSSREASLEKEAPAKEDPAHQEDPADPADALEEEPTTTQDAPDGGAGGEEAGGEGPAEEDEEREGNAGEDEDEQDGEEEE